MRIGAGALRGRRLRVPAGIRPTGGRAREALFDIWAARLAGCRFLDLFAGGGAVGLEALSRGAAACVAVEGAAPVFRVLRSNFEGLAPEGAWRLVRGPLPRALDGDRLRSQGPFDLVFADPPYDFGPWPELLEGIAPHLAADAAVALEHGRRNRPPAGGGGLGLGSRRSYGETELSFYGLGCGVPLSNERPR